ncbi:MAG: hypothetical protein ACFCUS_01090 [Rubrimonas sp.]|uniref:hypothetical protein n=1 Tax=Rubrimonas sp. TaxID=2036015 RepID=UPI002FDE1962
MTQAELFEAAMLICFSISWYWSIARMLKVRTAVGKSAFFVVLICTGYVFGLSAKLLAWRATGELSPLIWLYGWNLMVTAFDLALVLHFTRVRDRLAPTLTHRPGERPLSPARPAP